MMGRASISSGSALVARRAFTLIEVVVAIGLWAVTAVALLVMQGSLVRSAGEIADFNHATQLTAASASELQRLRELPGPDGPPGGLEALAGLIPPSDSPQPLRLVAARDGARVWRESDADDAGSGLPRSARFFLIEVRQQPAPLNYVPGSGYLAVTFTARWPYKLAAEADAENAEAAGAARAAMLVLNAALTP